jgi:Tfp pilus assembly protein FimT
MGTAGGDALRDGTMNKKTQSGFSMLELIIVVTTIMIVTAMAIPLVMNSTNNYRLRTAGTEYANLLQTARMKAVQDDQFYPVIVPLAGNMSSCVDLNMNSACDAPVGAEPGVLFAPEVQFQAYTAAPSVTGLRALYLPSTCGSNAACVTVNPSTWGPTFGARGLPCQAAALTLGGACTLLSAGGTPGENTSPGSLPIAFEKYLKNTRNGTWEAITVSPAGRIREWYYDSTTTSWKALN